MTTKHSPLSELKRQADMIARITKAAERGEVLDVKWADRIAEARKKEAFVAAVVMDDKILKITLPWTVIRETSEVALSAYIMGRMREERNNN